MSAAPTTPPTRSKSWTVKVREKGVEALPPDRLLPDGQPTYVASWIYPFGVASIASLIVIIGSGFVLSLKGPAWWHYTSVGHFFNSIHLWSVELFFFVMVVHLWGKYWMAAWRGRRWLTWVTGGVCFLALPFLFSNKRECRSVTECRFHCGRSARQGAPDYPPDEVSCPRSVGRHKRHQAPENSRPVVLA